MSQVLFSKYNSLRRPEFRIVTEIREQDGEKFVMKRAMEPAAENHIQRIADNRKLLENYYTDIQVIPVKLQEESLVFPFVQGISLHEKLVNDCSDREDLIRKALNLLDETLAIRKEHLGSFERTEEFERVFGKTDLGNVPAVCPANIDALFSNFMDCDGNLQCIDYEWVFNFSVPVGFVRYRALRYLHYELEKLVFDGMPMADYLTKCGFSEEEQKCYEQMEYAFQFYVHGEKLKYHYLNQYVKAHEEPVELINRLEKAIQDKDQHIANVSEVLCEKDKAIEQKKTDIKNLNDAIQNKETHIENLETQVKSLEETVHVKEMHEENLEDTIRAKETHIENLETQVKSLEETVHVKEIHEENLEDTIRTKEAHIENLEGIIREKDVSIGNLQDTIHDKDAHIGNLQNVIDNKEADIGNLQNAIHDKDVHIGNLDNIIRVKDEQIRFKEAQFNEISNAFFWKITKPARMAVTKTRVLISKNERVYGLFRFTKKTLKYGPKKALIMRKAEKAQAEKIRAIAVSLSEEETKRQKEFVFDRKTKFSILVPLYNTPENFLVEMIDSVLGQTYGGWELCLADGSDAEHAYVGEICRKYAKKDKRIRYKKLKKNGGISENTNACIEMATGDYIGLFDHDDLLHPYALFEYMKVICEKNADFIYSDENTFHDTPADAYNPHFKPDFAPDTLRANNYICHFTVFKKDLLEKAGGGFRKEFDGSQDFDMVLRLTEQAKCIVHIPKILYYWRAHKNSVAESVTAKPYVINAAKKAIAEHLKRIGLEGEALDSPVPSMYRLKYKIQGEPLISILIPNKDHIEDLKRCIDSIREKSTYRNYEIIIIENNSEEQQTFAYYEELQQDERIRVVRWEKGFNYSAINNFGFTFAKGEHILLLNNDVEIISPDWLQEMLMYSQRSDVGAVGAKLYYPDHTIQHAGLGIGLLTLAGHYHRHFDGNHPGYMGRLIYAQDLSGVTAACMMMPRHVYEEMNGLDETFEVAFNDVDLCMRIRKAGYLIVFTPYAELYHYESKSRGSDEAPEKRARFVGEVTRFQERWKKELAAGDPYYNPNLSLDKEDFSLR